MDLGRPPLRCAARIGTGFLIVMLAASGFGPGRFAGAGFPEGLAAFDGGDLRGAYEEWLPLARDGDLTAQVALAGLLEGGGPGLERDIVAAAGWYLLAASAGDAIAQMNLAELYAQGRGLARDPVRALAWFILAAEQGRGWAAERRDALSIRLKADQRAAAKELAASLRTRQ